VGLRGGKTLKETGKVQINVAGRAMKTDQGPGMSKGHFEETMPPRYGTVAGLQSSLKG